MTKILAAVLADKEILIIFGAVCGGSIMGKQNHHVNNLSNTATLKMMHFNHSQLCCLYKAGLIGYWTQYPANIGTKSTHAILLCLKQ
jgi:hypothetical protein